MEVLLQAIAASDGSRRSVTTQVLRGRLRSAILGRFHFDGNGDIDPAGISIYRIRSVKLDRAILVSARHCLRRGNGAAADG